LPFQPHIADFLRLCFLYHIVCFLFVLSEENDVKRNIENFRMALHAIEGNQIEKEKF
jgi:hypothetical protein